MRRARALTAFAIFGLAGAACDWRDFDATLAKAPVLSLGAPPGYKASDVGRVLLPLKVPQSRAATGVTARFLMSGTDAPSVAIVELDSAGRAKTYGAPASELQDLAGSNAPLLSAVQIDDNKVLLGAPGFGAMPGSNVDARGRLVTLTIVETASGLDLKVTRGGDPGEIKYQGLALAAGRVSGDEAAIDVAVVSMDTVQLFEDNKDTAPVPSVCDVGIDRTLAFNKFRIRAVALGNVAGDAGTEIIVGVPGAGEAPGKVRLIKRGAKELECVMTIDAPRKQPNFGASVAVTDLDQNGQPDLVVGAAGSRAYVYYGPLDPLKPAVPDLELKHPDVTEGSPTGDFGYRVFAMDVDGNGTPEILVSAPEAKSGSQDGAGKVFVFDKAGMKLATVEDTSPEKDASFGVTLSSLPFSPSG